MSETAVPVMWYEVECQTQQVQCTRPVCFLEPDSFDDTFRWDVK